MSLIIKIDKNKKIEIEIQFTLSPFRNIRRKVFNKM